MPVILAGVLGNEVVSAVTKRPADSFSKRKYGALETTHHDSATSKIKSRDNSNDYVTLRKQNTAAAKKQLSLYSQHIVAKHGTLISGQSLDKTEFSQGDAARVSREYIKMPLFSISNFVRQKAISQYQQTAGLSYSGQGEYVGAIDLRV